MKYISPHDSLKTSLSLEINNKKSTSLSEQKSEQKKGNEVEKFHQFNTAKKKKNRKIKYKA